MKKNINKANIFLLSIIILGLYIMANSALWCFSDIFPFKLVKYLTGLIIVFFIPGIFLIPRTKVEQSKLSLHLLKALGANVAFLVATTTIIKLLGFTLNQYNLLLLIIIGIIAGRLLIWRRKDNLIIINDFKIWSAILISGLLCFLLVFYLVYYRDLRKTENDFLSNAIWEDIAHDKFEIIPDLDIVYQKGLFPVSIRKYSMAGDKAVILYFNNSLSKKVIPCRFIWQNQQDNPEMVRILRNGEEIARVLIPARFIFGKHPRNYQANNLWWSKNIVLEPGKNKIEFLSTVSNNQNQSTPTLFYDLTNVNKRECKELIQRYFLVGDQGDRREVMEIADNFKKHLFSFTYSFDGDVFDGGGYTIAIMPLYPYLLMLSSLLVESGLPGINYYFIFCLALIFVYITILSVRNLTEKNGSRLPFLLIPITMIIYTLINRIGREAVSDEFTILVLFFLASLYFLLEKEKKYFLLMSALLILNKPGFVLVNLSLLAFLIIYQEKARALKIWVKVIFIWILLMLSLAYAGWQLHLWPGWYKIVKWEYGYRFQLIWQIFHGGWEHLWYLLRRMSRFTTLVLAGSYLLPFTFFLKKDKVSKLLLIIVTGYYLVLGFSDTYRIYYFVPLIPLVTIIAVRNLVSLTQTNIKYRWLAVVGILFGLAASIGWYWLGVDYTETAGLKEGTILTYSRVHPDLAGGYYFREADKYSAENLIKEAITGYSKAADISVDLRAPAYFKMGMLDQKNGEQKGGVSIEIKNLGGK